MNISSKLPYIAAIITAVVFHLPANSSAILTSDARSSLRQPTSQNSLFFINQKAINWVNSAEGFSLGSVPSLAVADKGMSRTISTETLHVRIYAFRFDQQGLMAGSAVQGCKISRID